ncbi:MAG: hypothetical protein HY397_03565 [Candidatus Doudnabacteria bacterium]|nr:hypothetical protein [Candidatus Doudnabacteria bacterium]
MPKTKITRVRLLIAFIWLMVAIGTGVVIAVAVWENDRKNPQPLFKTRPTASKRMPFEARPMSETGKKPIAAR